MSSESRGFHPLSFPLGTGGSRTKAVRTVINNVRLRGSIHLKISPGAEVLRDLGALAECLRKTLN